MTILVFMCAKCASNQPIAAEMSRTARRELSDERDGWNRDKRLPK